MKLTLALLALVAFCTAFEVRTFKKSDLERDLEDFVELIPVDEIFEITLEYMSDDEEFQKVVEYLQSKKFRQLVIDIEAIREVHVLMKYLEKAGIDVYEMVNRLNDLLNIPRIKPKSGSYKITGGGIKGYVKDVLKVLPLDEMKELYEEKLATSKAFRDFINQLKSDNFQKIVNAVYKNPEFQRILKKLREAGIDLKIIKDLLLAILGIKIPDRFLQ